MPYLLIGAAFEKAAMEARERLSLAPGEMRERLPRWLAACRFHGLPAEGLALLATCHRTEVYCWSPPGDGLPLGPAQALAALWRGLCPAVEDAGLAGGVEIREGEDVAGHLFRVASGLESPILGDTEILGQVKDAMQLAREAGTLGARLDRLFSGALRAGRRIRRETGISRGSQSVGGAVLKTLRQVVADAFEARILVLGTGRAAADIAGQLAKARFSRVVIAGRDFAEAQRLALRVGATPAAWEDAPGWIAVSDAIVAATGARLAELSREAVAAFRQAARRADLPLAVIDIGVPRNADPAAGSLPGVTLRNLDELEQESAESREMRLAELPAVERILAAEQARWLRRHHAIESAWPERGPGDGLKAEAEVEEYA